MARVLVIDDDELFRDYLATELRRAGYWVRELADGRELPQLLAQDAYDALITDLMMPQVNGALCIRLARAMVPDLPVIAVTGAAAGDLPPEAADAASLNAAAVLAKPVDPRALLDLLERVIAARGR